MFRLMSTLALGVLALGFTGSAKADYHGHGSRYSSGSYRSSYSSGYSGHGYGGRGYGYGGYGHGGYGNSYRPSYGGGHLDFRPSHTDYHIGGRRYEVLPGPHGSSYTSPYPHYHRR